MTMTDLHVWKKHDEDSIVTKYPWLSRHKLISNHFQVFFWWSRSVLCGQLRGLKKTYRSCHRWLLQRPGLKTAANHNGKTTSFWMPRKQIHFCRVGNWMETNIWANNIHYRWSKKQQRCGNWVKNPLTLLPWHVFPPFSSGFDAGVARWKGGWHLAVAIRKLISTRLQMESRPNPMGNPMESSWIAPFSSGFPWFCPPPVRNCSELLRN